MPPHHIVALLVPSWGHAVTAPSSSPHITVGWQARSTLRAMGLATRAVWLRSWLTRLSRQECTSDQCSTRIVHLLPCHTT
ncbi:hypothetical protein DFH09DRAFT_1180772 [Mycena vulgaris]|nr:hypothetical protein DFH09DRAFT_1180772 [Mycena vulgaris]